MKVDWAGPVPPRTGTTRRRWLALAAAALPAAAARGQGGGTVRVLVPTTAGAGLDAAIRAAQPALAQALGAAIVIDNQAGASGLIALQMLARAAPDGQVLGVSTNNLVIVPTVQKSLPFDVLRDFTPIAIVGSIPLVLVTNPGRIAATNLKEFVADLKARGDSLNYGSSGAGTALHFATERLLDEIGMKVRHIPYKGVTPMVTDVVGGQVDFVTSALQVVLPHIRSGKLRAIGLCAAERSAVAPEIPTLIEQGLPGFVEDSWVGVFGPKGLAPALLRRLHDAVTTAWADPAVKEWMARQGNTIRVTTPDEAQAMVRRDLAKYAALAKKINLEAQ